MARRSFLETWCLARVSSKLEVDDGVVAGVEEVVPLPSGLLSVEDG
jgi:hypothetical protein